MTPDPYRAASGGASNPADPQIWNRYAYVENDPVNFRDPQGLFMCADRGEGKDYDDALPEGGGSSDNGQGGSGGGKGGGVGGAILGGSPFSQDCMNALKADQKSTAAVERALSAKSTLQAAVQGTSIDWTLLAAIGIRETGFLNIAEVDGAGVGVGVFQITVSPTSGVTAVQAGNVAWAAKFAAGLLNNNRTTLAAEFPNFTPSQLLQATAASYNFGTANISGNPNTIDLGSAGGNYGSNVIKLMDCFH